MFSLRIKTIFILLMCALSCYFVAPNFVNNKFLPNDNKINLGLDLRGGVSLLLQIDFESYINEHVDNFSDEISKILREDKIQYSKLTVSPKQYLVSVRFNNEIDNKLVSNLRKIGKNYSVRKVDSSMVNIYYTDDYIRDIKDKVIKESINNIRRRIDALGTKEITIQMQGDSRILVQVPGVNNPDEIKSILGKTAILTFQLLDHQATDLNNINRLTTQILYDSEGAAFPVLRKIIISGDMLSDASAGFNSKGLPGVFFKFNTLGTKKFAQTTKENTGKLFAIILDDTVLTAPVIREPILGGQGEITGSFTIESANELSILLRAGALPAPLNIIEERTVGPTLGEDSIKSGKIASIISLCLVILFMIMSYTLLGIYASLALTINMLFIFAIMSILQITFTLPGIAGIVLTIGMAVDANVLIFERIKEELNVPKISTFKAVEKGFHQAIATILDSNITTLIGAVILFIIGSGPICGFAITLSVGLICSMFSSIVITKLLITYRLRTKKSIL